MRDEITRTYTNSEVTVVWKPDGAITEEIVAQVQKCPGGALSYIMNEEAG